MLLELRPTSPIAGDIVSKVVEGCLKQLESVRLYAKTLANKDNKLTTRLTFGSVGFLLAFFDGRFSL
jgi:hypothetical protein